VPLWRSTKVISAIKDESQPAHRHRHRHRHRQIRSLISAIKDESQPVPRQSQI
jgi:hypothetical protein